MDILKELDNIEVYDPSELLYHSMCDLFVSYIEYQLDMIKLPDKDKEFVFWYREDLNSVIYKVSVETMFVTTWSKKQFYQRDSISYNLYWIRPDLHNRYFPNHKTYLLDKVNSIILDYGYTLVLVYKEDLIAFEYRKMDFHVDICTLGFQTALDMALKRLGHLSADIEKFSKQLQKERSSGNSQYLEDCGYIPRSSDSVQGICPNDKDLITQVSSQKTIKGRNGKTKHVKCTIKIFGKQLQ